MTLYKLFKNHSVRLPLTLVVCVVVLCAAILLSNRHEQLGQAVRLATTHSPENYSELYFTNYAALSKSLETDVYYPISFTIANHESKTYTYTYRTKIIEPGFSWTSPTKTVTVADGRTAHEMTSIVAKRPGEQVELFVSVLNKNLTIHFKAQS